MATIRSWRMLKAMMENGFLPGSTTTPAPRLTIVGRTTGAETGVGEGLGGGARMALAPAGRLPRSERTTTSGKRVDCFRRRRSWRRTVLGVRVATADSRRHGLLTVREQTQSVRRALCPRVAPPPSRAVWKDKLVPITALSHVGIEGDAHRHRRAR
jgi:hypothetical protein